jgi:segregation and condensation protein B
MRGVSVSKGTLDLLLETGWVQPKGRRETPGRPVTWVTSPAFLDHFDLASLDDLPRIEELLQLGLLGGAAPGGGALRDPSDDALEDGE